MLNKYIIRIPKEGYTLLYNTFNKKLIKLPVVLEKIDTYIENLSIKDKELLKNDDFFKKNSFGIDIDILIKKLRDEICYSDKYASFMIHLGYDCNMNCTYCYQQEIQITNIMNEKTEKELYQFFEKVKYCNNLKKIDISFIGGEPLLHTKLMLRIIDKCNKIFDKAIKQYALITNGTLFNENIIKKLNKVAWDLIQITVDGPPRYHNKSRPFKNGKGTFNTIISNLKMLQKYEYPVVINCNLGEENIHGVEELILKLKIEKIKYPLAFSLIFDTINMSKKVHNLNNKNINSIWKIAHEIAENYGYKFEPFYRMPYMVCGFQRRNVFNISPEGFLYKCMSGMEDVKYRISHISQYMSQEYTDKINSFMNLTDLRTECKNCNLQIPCGGGCNYKMQVYGEYCNKEFLLSNDVQLIK